MPSNFNLGPHTEVPGNAFGLGGIGKPQAPVAPSVILTQGLTPPDDFDEYSKFYNKWIQENPTVSDATQTPEPVPQPSPIITPAPTSTPIVQAPSTPSAPKPAAPAAPAASAPARPRGTTRNPYISSPALARERKERYGTGRSSDSISTRRRSSRGRRDSGSQRRSLSNRISSRKRSGGRWG